MTARRRRLRLVYPHQLFESHLSAPKGTRFVLVEDDLLLRQYPFHAQKLVLHRASLRAFARRLREAGFEVDLIETSAAQPSGGRLADLIEQRRPDSLTVVDVVDDWLARDCRRALADGGYRLQPDDVEESPNFLTTRADLADWFGHHRARMQDFYAWQRRRLDILVEGDQPVGGRWSFDADNRKKLPRGHPVPERSPAAHDDEAAADVAEAIEWVGEEFPDAPGQASSFAWPVTHNAAAAALEEFIAERLDEFGPYEDALTRQHPFVFHSALTPALNIGLLDPGDLVDAALRAASERKVPIESLEGFLRQVIGWREYMRATYHLYGRRMRVSNVLRHTRHLGDGWWNARTGLDPLDHVIGRVLERGWAHHIERLMILGNAMCLLRIEPDEVYEWFMALFVDAYDWVMVPNVYAMSQYAAASAITTKPYVSGSNYLKKMSDYPSGDWTETWDALYWTFVRDHRDVFETNPRARMMPRMWDDMDGERRERLERRAGDTMAGAGGEGL